MLYTIAGITVQTEPIKDEDGQLIGYRVVVNGEHVGNRIERLERPEAETLFVSYARNELVIASRETLRDAVEDVLNDGMRDKVRS